MDSPEVAAGGTVSHEGQAIRTLGEKMICVVYLENRLDVMCNPEDVLGMAGEAKHQEQKLRAVMTVAVHS
ncbi:unnamed protein product [Bubo scandiacus]